MVRLTEHVSILLWGRDYKEIASSGSGLTWLRRWGSSTSLFLPESPPYSDEDVDLKMWVAGRTTDPQSEEKYQF